MRESIHTADNRTAFRSAFEAIYGNSPFPWQERLFQGFCRGDFPDALDLPTGLGKTSVMAIWLLARALADPTARERIPRRLVYVVDRRAVVDQATVEAEKLRKAIEGEAEHFSKLDEHARARAIQTGADLKKRLGFDETRKLPISTLRGAYVDNREWLNDPAAPAIIVGTVDMIGSRLLFCGYGVSRKMRPYHAGLLGADTLIVLDEAHLVPAFEALLRAIARDYRNQFGPRSPDDREIVPGLRLMSLSATGREVDNKDNHIENGKNAARETVFCLDADDERHPVVRQRLAANKKLTIHDAFDGKPSLVDELAGRAWTLASSKPARVLIYCHARGDAEKVKAALDRRRKKDGLPAELLVGQRRVHERDQVLAWLKRCGFIEGPTEASATAFLVATAAGEVGIDLDADHIVCDLVEWERMVQRLGRVNRRGGKQSQVEVIALPSKEDKKEGEAWTERLKRLRAPLDLLPTLEGGGRDASPGAIAKLKANPANADLLRCAQTPEPLRPALNRALVDAWSMTSLEEHTGRPDVQPWLRGWGEDAQQTTIAWRSHLPLRIRNGETVRIEKSEIDAFFEAAPPHLSELLEAEPWRAVEWLIARSNHVLAEVQKRKKLGEIGPLGGDSIVLFVLNARDELEVDKRPDNGVLTLRSLAELGAKEKERKRKEFIESVNGRTLVVTAHLGGLKDGMLVDDEDAAPPSMDTDDDWEPRPFRVTSDAKPPEEPGWKQSYRFVREIDDDGEATRWLCVEEYEGQAETEDSRALAARKEQTLKDHREAVEIIARDFAHRIGLSVEYIDMLGLAGRWHDEGKEQLRWRLAFAVPRNSEALAKTKKFYPSLLDGYRHEFGSLFYAERNAEVQEHQEFKKLPNDLRDLLLHLIAAHHGNARPLISARNCDGIVADLEACVLEATLRFERLQKRWGPWGLAWWESLLRAADQMASRRHDESGETKGGDAQPDSEAA